MKYMPTTSSHLLSCLFVCLMPAYLLEFWITTKLTFIRGQAGKQASRQTQQNTTLIFLILQTISIFYDVMWASSYSFLLFLKKFNIFICLFIEWIIYWLINKRTASIFFLFLLHCGSQQLCESQPFFNIKTLTELRWKR